MRNLILFALLWPLIVLAQNRFGGSPYRAPNVLAPVPIQVMGEGRLSNFAVGTALKSHMGTTNILSNNFTGIFRTNCTWILYTNSQATGAAIVGATVPLEGQIGFYQPTVTVPDDTGSLNWNSRCNGGSNDIAPQATFKSGSEPSVLVVGFTITVSNWNPEGSGSTFKGFDVVRIGSSPYAICQFQDNVDAPNKINVLVHSPDGAGVGGAVVIFDNGEVYHCMLLYDAPQSKVGLRVYQKLSNGGVVYKGESLWKMTGGTIAQNVFFQMHDDHTDSGSPFGLSTSVAGDIRLSHFWGTTNRQTFYNHDFPKY